MSGDAQATKTTSKLWSTAGFSVLILATLLLMAGLIRTCHDRFTSTGLYTREYEGRVVDKSMTLGESETGSYVVRRLHIKGNGGGVFQISVNKDLYERVQVGMWIKGSKAGVELSWDELK